MSHYTVYDQTSLNDGYLFNLLKPSGNFTYDQVQDYKTLRGAHIAFMCFVRIS
jgi:hypothetical protein